MTTENKLIKYDATITLGHILTTLGVLITMVTWGIRLESKVSAQEQIRQLEKKNTDLQITQLQDDLSQQKQDTVTAFASIQQSLYRIEDRLNERGKK